MADQGDIRPFLNGELLQSQLPAAVSHFEALKQAMGDQSKLLDELPFDRIEFLPHADEDLIGRKTLCPWKIRVGTTKLFGEPIYAYLLKNTGRGHVQGTLAVSFFSFSEDELEVSIHDISTLVHEDLREEYSGAPTQDTMKVLVKIYFIQKGACDNVPVVLSNTLLNDTERVCKSFLKRKTKAVGRDTRRSSIFVDSVPTQGSSSGSFYSFEIPSRPATPLVSVAPMTHASQSMTSLPPTVHQERSPSNASISFSRPSLQGAQSTFNQIIEQSYRTSSESTMTGSEILDFPSFASSTQPQPQREPQRQARISFPPRSQPQIELQTQREISTEPDNDTITFNTYLTRFQAPYSKLRATLCNTNTALTSARTDLRTYNARNSQAKARISQAKAQFEKAQAELEKAQVELADMKQDLDSTSAKVKNLENTKDRVKRQQKALVARLDDEAKSVWAFAKQEEENTSSDEEPLAKRAKKT